MLDLEYLNTSEMFWIQDNECQGHFEDQEKFFTYGVVTGVSPGKVSFPAIGHGLAPGQVARFSGFNHSGYNAIHLIDPSSTENEIVISADFYPEQITINCSYRTVLSLGSSGECPGIVEGVKVQFVNETSGVVWIDSATKGAGASKVALGHPVASQEVVRITGLDVGADGVKIASVVDGNGSRNLSTTDAVPTQTNSDNVYSSSQTATYEAFKVFNDDFGASRRWLTAVNNTTGWVTYDFGSDKKIINKYRWRTFETDSNAVPGLWSLEASDDNVNWITLHSASNSVQTANIWIPLEPPGYFTFFNSHPFRYYRFHVTQNCGHPQYLCVEEIELIEAPEPICPQDVVFVYTRPEIVGDTTDWGEIESVHMTENNPADSSIYYALSFDGAKSWSVYQNDVWSKIVTFESGQWKFRNQEGLWEIVNDNNMFSAFRRSLEAAQNWMSAAQIASLNVGQWSQTGGWDNELRQIQIAVALSANGHPDAGISAIEIRYSSRAKSMRLVSLPQAMNPYSKNICASLLVKGMHESVRLYVSTEEPPSWIDCGVLQKRASLHEGIDFYVADVIQTHENVVLRLRAECESSHGAQFYGWAVSHY
ncbi:MAG: discoidin domain-containing protein, partial [Desulfomonilaceae bacterium]